MIYVGNSEVCPDTSANGTLNDPHLCLLGALASIWRKHTTIRLIATSYELMDFKSSAFPEAFFNTDPFNPFQNLSAKRNIEKVLIEPEFCEGATASN